MLPWFQERFTLYLAPIAGITNTTFRKLYKGDGGGCDGVGPRVG